LVRPRGHQQDWPRYQLDRDECVWIRAFWARWSTYGSARPSRSHAGPPGGQLPATTFPGTVASTPRTGMGEWIAISIAASLPRDIPTTASGVPGGSSSCKISRAENKVLQRDAAKLVRQPRPGEVRDRQGGDSLAGERFACIGGLAAARSADQQGGRGGISPGGGEEGAVHRCRRPSEGSGSEICPAGHLVITANSGGTPALATVVFNAHPATEDNEAGPPRDAMKAACVWSRGRGAQGAGSYEPCCPARNRPGWRAAAGN
jgi:hypothetical protein